MRRSLLLGCIILACGSISFAADEPLKLVRTIPLQRVEGRIDHMTMSPNGRHLFVAALGNDSVEVVDVERGIVVGTIDKIKEPQGVAYIPTMKKLVVASG